MYQDLKQRFWQTRMKRDVARYVSQCDVCRTVKAQHQKPAGLLQPLEIPEWKWDHIEMDFIIGFPLSQKKNNAIFVVIDNLSKVAHFFPVKTPFQQLSWLICTPQELCLCMAFPRRSVLIEAVFSPPSYGRPFKRRLIRQCCSVPLITLRQVGRSSA